MTEKCKVSKFCNNYILSFIYWPLFVQKHFSKRRGPRTPAQKAARRAALMQNVPGNSDVDEAMLDTATAMSMVRVTHPCFQVAVHGPRAADSFTPGNGRWSTLPCFLTARITTSLVSISTLMTRRRSQALASIGAPQR